MRGNERNLMNEQISKLHQVTQIEMVKNERNEPMRHKVNNKQVNHKKLVREEMR